MFKRIFTGIAIFGMAALAPPALAQAICDPREAIVERLQSDYAETLRAAGLQSPQDLVEIWVSEATGSWTILTTRAGGISCIRATGMHWQEFPAAPQAGGIAARHLRE